jgi:hypothetical protein
VTDGGDGRHVAIGVVGVALVLVGAALVLVSFRFLKWYEAGVAGTYYALAEHLDAGGSDHNVFYNSTWGLWAALVGYLLGAAGAVIGPRRRT